MDTPMFKMNMNLNVYFLMWKSAELEMMRSQVDACVDLVHIPLPARSGVDAANTSPCLSTEPLSQNPRSDNQPMATPPPAASEMSARPAAAAAHECKRRDRACLCRPLIRFVEIGKVYKNYETVICKLM